MTMEKVKKPIYKRWYVWVIAVLVIGGAIGAGDSDDTASNESSPVVAETNEPEPEKEPITLEQSAIDDVTEFIKSETLVNDAAVVVDEDKKSITLAIVVNAAINEDTAKDIADSFVRQLASRSSGANPTKDYLGGLWDEYDLRIAIGTGPNDIKWSGAKVTSSPKITW